MIYRPTLDLLSRFLKSLTRIINFFFSAYGNFILMDDFNAQPIDNATKHFIKVNGLKLLHWSNFDQ